MAAECLTGMPLVVTNLTAQATDRLYRALVSGELRPGQRINEADLARRMGISRNPIREALRRLEWAGLLRSEPNRGTFVRHMTPADVDEIYAFRKTMEIFAARLAGPRLTDEAVAELRRRFEAIRDAARRDDAVALAQCDVLFHRTFFELSGNSRLLRSFDDLSAESRMLILLINPNVPPDELRTEHAPILDAAAARDMAALERALTQHIDDAWALIRATVDARGGVLGPEAPEAA